MLTNLENRPRQAAASFLGLGLVLEKSQLQRRKCGTSRRQVRPAVRSTAQEPRLLSLLPTCCVVSFSKAISGCRVDAPAKRKEEGVRAGCLHLRKHRVRFCRLSQNMLHPTRRSARFWQNPEIPSQKRTTRGLCRAPGGADHWPPLQGGQRLRQGGDCTEGHPHVSGDPERAGPARALPCHPRLPGEERQRRGRARSSCAARPRRRPRWRPALPRAGTASCRKAGQRHTPGPRSSRASSASRRPARLRRRCPSR